MQVARLVPDAAASRLSGEKLPPRRSSASCRSWPTRKSCRVPELLQQGGSQLLAGEDPGPPAGASRSSSARCAGTGCDTTAVRKANQLTAAGTSAEAHSQRSSAAGAGRHRRPSRAPRMRASAGGPSCWKAWPAPARPRSTPRHRGGRGPRPQGDRPGSGNITDPPGGQTLPAPLRRPHRHPAQRPEHRRAVRRIHAHPLGRGRRGHRPALGAVRAAAGPRHHRHRRGERRLLQAGERPPLRRPPRCSGARAAGGRWSSFTAAPRPAWKVITVSRTASCCPSGLPAPPCPRWRSSTCARRKMPSSAAGWSPRSTDNLAAGGKTILLLNSRGYARFLQCGHCGHVWECANCEVSLTIHSRIQQLLCHHCGHSGGDARHLPGLQLHRAAPLGRRHRAAGGRGAPAFPGGAGLPARRRHRPRLWRRAAHPRGVRPGRRRHPAGHPDGRQGPSLSRR